jgi:hypothetical protein
MRPTMTKHIEYLDALHRHQFPDSDRERLGLLVCEMAEIFGVEANELRTDAALSQLSRVAKRRWWDNTCQDDLEYLLCLESRGQPPPDAELRTVGDVLTYLLT